MSDPNPPQGKNNEISKRINTRINKIEEKTNPRDADEKEIKQKKNKNKTNQKTKKQNKTNKRIQIDRLTNTNYQSVNWELTD